MLKSHEKFYSENGRRLVLVASEEEETRRHMEEVLGEAYMILFAEDDHHARDLIHANADVLSLAILQLPHDQSMAILAMIQEAPELLHIPVTLMHRESWAEVDALTHGAVGFLPIPFPSKAVITARIQRIIELSEDRAIINSTERDGLTGLYNREYFYRYAEQYDQHHKTKEMDAIVIDVNNFRTINERFGTAYGDEILRRIGERVRDMVRDSGGIVCRREADTFQVYCPHGKNYQAILDNASIGLAGEKNLSDRVRLRMGVYAKVDKKLDIERRFDRANMAAGSARSDFTRGIAMYDSSLYMKELEDAALVEDFQAAIRERQFKVYYQPQYDVRAKAPILASAEALVRWMHPKHGLISPGRFIPLFEDNGLIQPLDHYVWEEAARQVRTWKDRLNFSVPVSVNVSRVNMYDPHMVDFLLEICDRHGVDQKDLYLEITESAYTDDSEQIIRRVQTLRDLGFRIEMDDFGTGYSSLNMIATLPIDVLKLDMEFVQSTLRGSRNARMMEIMLDIAEYLDVPVVAEGVETEDQMQALQRMGCEVIQGYYFSKPLPPENFEALLLQRRLQGVVMPINGSSGRHISSAQRLAEGQEDGGVPGIALTLIRGFNRIFDVDPVTEQYTEFKLSGDGRILRQEREGVSFFDYHRRHLVHYMHPEDQKNFLHTFSKDRMMLALEKQNGYSGIFRLVFGRDVSTICVQASCEGKGDQRRIIIGLSNVDVQTTVKDGIRDIVRTVGKDPLTSVKNLTSYIQAERQINAGIAAGDQEPFAMVVVDVLGYHEILDRLGQHEADRCVLEVSSIVCEVYDHSPVYRIDDDEFIALLMRRDYENRQDLREEMRQANEQNCEKGEVSFACGMAEFRREEDTRLSIVFERAKAAQE